MKHYASIFDITEINTTFYNIPSQAMTQKWHNDPPGNFVFTAKLPKAITHEGRLEPTQHLDRFLQAVRPLGTKLKTIVIQLPPSLSYNEAKDKLEKMLDHLPDSYRYALEARHHDKSLRILLTCLYKGGLENRSNKFIPEQLTQLTRLTPKQVKEQGNRADLNDWVTVFGRAADNRWLLISINTWGIEKLKQLEQAEKDEKPARSVSINDHPFKGKKSRIVRNFLIILGAVATVTTIIVNSENILDPIEKNGHNNISISVKNSSNTALSIDQSGGITAGTVNVGPNATLNLGSQVRHLNAQWITALIPHLPENKTKVINIVSVGGDQEALQFATEIKNYLASHGWKTNGVDQVWYTEPVTGQTISRNPDGGINITIGANIR